MMRYVSCNRNGKRTEQTLDTRACLACNCQLNIRKACKEFNKMLDEEVQQDVAWLAKYGYAPHLFASRLKNLEEVPIDEMQIMQPHHDSPRDVKETTVSQGTTRGAMLQV